MAPRIISNYKKGYDQLLNFLFKMERKYADVPKPYDKNERVKGDEKIRFKSTDKRCGPSSEKMDIFVSKLQLYNAKKHVKVIELDPFSKTVVIQDDKVLNIDPIKRKSIRKKKPKKSNGTIQHSVPIIAPAKPPAIAVSATCTNIINNGSHEQPAPYSIPLIIPTNNGSDAITVTVSTNVADSNTSPPTNCQITNNACLLETFENRSKHDNPTNFEQDVAPLEKLTQEDLKAINDVMEIENDLWHKEHRQEQPNQQDSLVPHSDDPMMLQSQEIDKILNNILGLPQDQGTSQTKDFLEFNSDDLFNLV